MRKAYKSQKEDSLYIHTPDGFERVRVVPAGKGWHVPMLIQYWKAVRNVETFRNFDSFDEWEEYICN